MIPTLEILSESTKFPRIENKSQAFPYKVPNAIIAMLYLGFFIKILNEAQKPGLWTLSAKLGATFGLFLINTKKGSDIEQQMASMKRIVSTLP